MPYKMPDFPKNLRRARAATPAEPAWPLLVGIASDA